MGLFNTKLWLIPFLVLSQGMYPVYSKQNPVPAQCKQLDATKPMVYLSFERLSKTDPNSFWGARMIEEPTLHGSDSAASKTKVSGQEVVWLKLTNNSNCLTKLRTLSVYKFTEMPDRLMMEIPDKAEIFVAYSLVPREGVKKEPPYLWGDEFFVSTLTPGHSAYFFVPLSFLMKDGFDVKLDFAYDQEKDYSSAHPLHFLNFTNDDLPKDVREGRKPKVERERGSPSRSHINLPEPPIK